MDHASNTVQFKLGELQRLANHVETHESESAWLVDGDSLDPGDQCKRRIFIAAQAELAYVQVGTARLPLDELVELAGGLDTHLAGDASLGLFAALLNATADIRLSRGINPAFAVPAH